MYDFRKGHYKIYFYNDDDVFKKLIDQYKNDLVMSDVLHICKCKNSATPYYMRMSNGVYCGRNTDGDHHSYDTQDMIIVDGHNLIFSLPEDLFIM